MTDTWELAKSLNRLSRLLDDLASHPARYHIRRCRHYMHLGRIELEREMDESGVFEIREEDYCDLESAAIDDTVAMPVIRDKEKT